MLKLLGWHFLSSGAKRLVPCGLGDDDQCIDDDFTAWYVSSLANSADPMLSVHHEC
jgi:hypothetical protein